MIRVDEKQIVPTVVHGDMGSMPCSLNEDILAICRKSACDGNVVIGLSSCVHILDSGYENLECMLCLISLSTDDDSDQIASTLLTAYCQENNIIVLHVESKQSLWNFLQDCRNMYYDPEDLSCALVMWPHDESLDEVASEALLTLDFYQGESSPLFLQLPVFDDLLVLENKSFLSDEVFEIDRMDSLVMDGNCNRCYERCHLDDLTDICDSITFDSEESQLRFESISSHKNVPSLLTDIFDCNISENNQSMSPKDRSTENHCSSRRDSYSKLKDQDFIIEHIDTG